MSRIPSVVTEDGITLNEGDRAFNYYDMKPGRITEFDRHQHGWFTFEHEDGTKTTLNGERICSRSYAERHFPEAFRP